MNKSVGRVRIVIGGILVFMGVLTVLSFWLAPLRSGDDRSGRWAPLLVFSLPGLLLILSARKERRKLRTAGGSPAEQAGRSAIPASPVQRTAPEPAPKAAESISQRLVPFITLSETDFPYSACPLCHGSFLSGDPGRRRLKVVASSTEKDAHRVLCPHCDYNVTVLVGLQPDGESSRQPAAPSLPAANLLETLPKGKLEGKAYTGPPVRDLSQEAVIQELLKLGLDRETAQAQVEASLVLVSTWPPALVESVYAADIPFKADNFVLGWAVHCVRHGAEIRRTPPKS